MKIFFSKIALLSISLIFVGLPLTVFAQQENYGLDSTAGAAGLKDGFETDVTKVVGNVIGTALSMIAVLFFILMLYGGFTWMTARGNEEMTKKALSTITAAIIGIIIVLSAYAITRFVLSSVEPGAIPGEPAAGGGSGGNQQPLNICSPLAPVPTGCEATNCPSFTEQGCRASSRCCNWQ